MKFAVSFRHQILDALKGYTPAQFRQDSLAGLNVMTLAFPLSMAFAISAGASPEAGLRSWPTRSTRPNAS